MPDAVIVSPHLDDGLLSATAQLVRPGARVVTVFAGEPAPGTPLGEWDRRTGATAPAKRIRERHDEDDAAMWLLGVMDGLTRVVHRPDDDTRRRKVAAMACYATQIPAVDAGHARSDGDPLVVGFEVSWSPA